MVDADTKAEMIFRYHKIKMHIPGYSFFIPYATFFSGEYDFLRPRKDDIVIDAGANIGDFTVKIARRVSTVIAIEPSKENLSYLRLNTENVNNIKIIPKAIGKKEGLIGFTGQGVSAGVNEYADNLVEIDTLDRICDDLKIGPTLLKMDIEGYEGDALKGMEKSIDSVRRMVIEIHDERNRRDCEDELIRHGFKIRYQNKMDVVKRTLKNIILHPLSFLKYDKLNHFYASGGHAEISLNWKVQYTILRGNSRYVPS